MAVKKEKHAPGVMLYFEDFDTMQAVLSGDQVKRLLCAIMQYAKTQKEDDLDDDKMVAMAFAMYKPKIDRDLENYALKVKRSKYMIYIRECKKKKIAPMLFELWVDSTASEILDWEESQKANESEFVSGTNYEKYLESDAWKEKREQRMKLDNYCCQVCGGTKNLHVHHLTYQRLGNEPMGDLITLCVDCHRKQHSETSF